MANKRNFYEEWYRRYMTNYHALGKEAADAFEGGPKGWQMKIARENPMLGEKAEYLKGIAQVGGSWIPIATSVILWGLLILFVIGPGAIAVLTIFNVLPVWVWIACLLVIIVMVTQRRTIR